MQFLQLQQQVGSISTTNFLGYLNPESPSPGPVFSTETFKEVDGDNDFDEEFFVEEVRKYHVFWTQRVGVAKMAPESRMLGHSCADYLVKKVG